MNEMECVGVGRRLVATVIDIVVFFVIGYVIAGANGGTTSDGFNLQGAPAFLAFGIWMLYYIVLEGALGATLGKLALGMRVTMDDGSKVGWQAVIIRNVLRIVDGIAFYLVAAILVWQSPKRQRLGDRLAHTVVLRRAAVSTGSAAPAAVVPQDA
jgi:uncharacterized RDD family membrane protein YckC